MANSKDRTMKSNDLVLIERGSIGAAIHAIENGRKAPNTVRLLREATHSVAFVSKPLEWEVYSGDKSVGERREHYGYHEFGYYVAVKSEDAWSVNTFTNRGKARVVGVYSTLSDAKAGAQNDFDGRAALPGNDELIVLRRYALDITRALTNLTGGGSEMFDGQIGEMFKADIHFCVSRIRDRHDRLHRLWASESLKRKQLEEDLATVANSTIHPSPTVSPEIE